MKDEEKESPQTSSGVAAGATVHESEARGVQRLSTISESEGDKAPACPESPGSTHHTTSSWSLCSTNFSSDTFQPTMGDDCAAIILTCLFCQLPEFLRIVPAACERAVNRCFPSCKLLCALSEPTHDIDCCSCKLDLDCTMLGSCHEATELLDLALEISEVCHR